MKPPPTHFRGFGPGAGAFFAALSANNEREWFLAHKADYEREVKGPMMDLVADLAPALAARDLPLQAEPKRAVFRIHRDVRFAKDKSPYKTNIGAVMTRDGDKRSPGLLYVHLDAGGGFAAVGFYMPEPDVLAAIRDRIAAHPAAWREVEAALAAEGLTLSHEAAAKRVPRGYEDAPAEVAKALKLKSFTVSRPLTLAEMAKPGLVALIADVAAKAAPLLRFGWRAVETR